MKTKFALICLMAIALVGCDSYVDTLRNTAGYQNVREVGRGYIMYEIEGGKVSCREHTHRSELTCWKTGAE
jgi:hypothetical protein